jgi:rRNA maturation RNase YbeY
VPVYFHSENTKFKFTRKRICKIWIKEIIESYRKSLGTVNIIFTSNSYLLEINQKYLNHNYFTDVITFDYSESLLISGDVFVSIDQVKVNSKDMASSFESELLRVIVHGVLHLLGFKDSNEEETQQIREKEDEALLLLEGIVNGEII